MHPSRAFGALLANSTACDVASTYWTGILCSRPGSDVHRPTSIGALDGFGPVVVVAVCNHITDQFGCIKLT